MQDKVPSSSSGIGSNGIKADARVNPRAGYGEHAKSTCVPMFRKMEDRRWRVTQILVGAGSENRPTIIPTGKKGECVGRSSSRGTRSSSCGRQWTQAVSLFCCESFHVCLAMSQSAEGLNAMLDAHDGSDNNDNVASNTKVGSRRSTFQRSAAITLFQRSQRNP